MPSIGEDYSLRSLTYRTAKDQHFEVYVIAKNPAEYAAHVENFKRAGFDVVVGPELISIKVEKKERVGFSDLFTCAPAHTVT